MSVSSCTVLIYFFCHDTKINNRSEFKQNNKHLGDIFLKCIFFVGEQKKREENSRLCKLTLCSTSTSKCLSNSQLQ